MPLKCYKIHRCKLQGTLSVEGFQIKTRRNVTDKYSASEEVTYPFGILSVCCSEKAQPVPTLPNWNLCKKWGRFFKNWEQKQGRCGGSQRISFRSGVTLEFWFNRKFLDWNIDHNVFLDENKKHEPSPKAETKCKINLCWSRSLRS